MNENVGLIGYGIMGNVIAEKLLLKGYNVLVHDKNPEAISNAKVSGCIVLSTPKEIAKQAKVVLLSLPHPHNVVNVVIKAKSIPWFLLFNFSIISTPPIKNGSTLTPYNSSYG